MEKWILSKFVPRKKTLNQTNEDKFTLKSLNDIIQYSKRGQHTARRSHPTLEGQFRCFELWSKFGPLKCSLRMKMSLSRLSATCLLWMFLHSDFVDSIMLRNARQCNKFSLRMGNNHLAKIWIRLFLRRIKSEKCLNVAAENFFY